MNFQVLLALFLVGWCLNVLVELRRIRARLERDDAKTNVPGT